MDLNIVIIDPVTRIVSFKLNHVPRRTVGIEGLLQLVAKTLLSTPGTDVWSPWYGGGIVAYKNRGLTKARMQSITADVLAIVKKSEEDIKRAQAAIVLDDDEILYSLEVLSVDFDESNLGINTHILVTAQSGLSADIRLPNQLGQIDSEEEIEKPTPVSIYNSKPVRK